MSIVDGSPSTSIRAISPTVLAKTKIGCSTKRREVFKQCLHKSKQKYECYFVTNGERRLIAEAIHRYAVS